MIMLKIGGSVITDKSAPKPTLNHENLKRIAKEISDSLPPSLIIVHGAGSFGHPLAKKYRIGTPTTKRELPRKMMGFSIIQRWVKLLNIRVCDALRKENIPVVSIQPSSFIIAFNGRIKHADPRIIISYLEKGFIPVTYGDVVLDANKELKMSVLSGDQIIKYLGETLKPEKVILGTDVDGVFDKDPKKYPDAKLIKKIKSPKDIEIETRTSRDVTGEMIGKIKELLLLAEKGIKSEIINAKTPGNIKKALLGQELKKTIIDGDTDDLG
ncbi:isopentenyl phosphate kinase [Methanothermobacter sp. MT-2]|nr:isopentenyl phosphate kinase [Methanothermobacter sp. MT-2]